MENLFFGQKRKGVRTPVELGLALPRLYFKTLYDGGGGVMGHRPPLKAMNPEQSRRAQTKGAIYEQNKTKTDQ